MVDDEERTLERPSTAQDRIERILWLGHRIASVCRIFVSSNDGTNWTFCLGRSMDTIWRGHKLLHRYRLRDNSGLHRPCPQTFGPSRWKPLNTQDGFVTFLPWVVVQPRFLKSSRFDCFIYNLSPSQWLATNSSAAVGLTQLPECLHLPSISQISKEQIWVIR